MECPKHSFWAFLDEQITVGRIRCPKMVYQEIVNGEEPLDDLARWAKTRRQSGLFVDADADVQKAMTKVADFVMEAEKLERQNERLEQRVDRELDEIEEEPSAPVRTVAEPTVLIPIEQRIRQRAYELYEQRGKIDGHPLDDWLQAEYEIKSTRANAVVAQFPANSRRGVLWIGGSRS